VDLQEPGNRGKSRDARFLKRILTPAECLKVILSRQADRTLWALWAAKESAFKVIKKRDPGVSARPRQYRVLFFSAPGNTDERKESALVSGVVTTPRGSVQIRLQFTAGYVHCIGTDAPWSAMDAIRWQVNEIPAGSDESQQVREEAKRHLACHFREAPEEIHIRAAGATGAPAVYLGDRRTSIDISMSHDGRFTAHAFSGETPFDAGEGLDSGGRSEASTGLDLAGCGPERVFGDRIRAGGYQRLP